MISLRRLAPTILRSATAGQCLFAAQAACQYRRDIVSPRSYASESSSQKTSQSSTPRKDESRSSSPTSAASSDEGHDGNSSSMPADWEDSAHEHISQFSELPNRHFGFNQHMVINNEFKEALRQVLWQFRAPIRYAFAYGSGVFPQSTKAPTEAKPSPHPNPPEAIRKWQTMGEKTIDFIFGVSFTQHWHSLNLAQHRDHYSFLGSLGSGVVSRVQDNIGAGAYFNPYITANGMMIKYGVINLDTIYRDLSEWDTLYIAGRLHKPVKILRDDPRIRLANQVNLISALRTALLMLPANFSERDLYTKIAGLSYMGDPRMTFNAEKPTKVMDIVDAQMPNFRQLYHPLIETLPNVTFNDSRTMEPGWMTSEDNSFNLEQDMDPTKRGNMVRRLPKTFRRRLYHAYRGIFEGSSTEFEELIKTSKSEDPFASRLAGDFEKDIAADQSIDQTLGKVVKRTVTWPTTTQSLKGILTGGPSRSWNYFKEKRNKGKKEKEVDMKISEPTKQHRQKNVRS